MSTTRHHKHPPSQHVLSSTRHWLFVQKRASKTACTGQNVLQLLLPNLQQQLLRHKCACGDLKQVLNYLAGGREVSNLVTIACQAVLARPASTASKKLAYDIAKTAALSSDDWDAACEGLRADVAGSHSPEVHAPPACTCSHFISP